MTMALLINYLDPSLSLTIAGGLFPAPYAPLVSLKCTEDSAETVCKACRLTAAQDSCVPWGRTLAASPAMQTGDKGVKNNRDKVTLSRPVPLLLCSAGSIFLNENHVFPFFSCWISPPLPSLTFSELQLWFYHCFAFHYLQVSPLRLFSFSFTSD